MSNTHLSKSEVRWLIREVSQLACKLYAEDGLWAEFLSVELPTVKGMGDRTVSFILMGLNPTMYESLGEITVGGNLIEGIQVRIAGSKLDRKK